MTALIEKAIQSIAVQTRYINFEAQASRYSIIYTHGYRPGLTMVTDGEGKWTAIIVTDTLLLSDIDYGSFSFKCKAPVSMDDAKHIVRAIREDTYKKRPNPIELFLKQLSLHADSAGEETLSELIENLIVNVPFQLDEDTAKDLNDIYIDTAHTKFELGILRGRAQKGGM